MANRVIATAELSSLHESSHHIRPVTVHFLCITDAAHQLAA
jgi:hypothetical protein